MTVKLQDHKSNRFLNRRKEMQKFRGKGKRNNVHEANHFIMAKDLLFLNSHVGKKK